MKIRVFFTTLLCFAGALSAQENSCNHNINVNVIDSRSKSPVQAASIAIESSTRQFIADEFGHATLGRICSGTTVLLIKAVGYDVLRKEFFISTDLNITVALNNRNILLNEVDVQAQRRVIKRPHTQSTIGEDELARNKGGVLADVLKSVPGVTALQTGATIAKPVIQGLHSNRILILNNGIRQEGQQWGMEHSPEVDPFVADKITIIKGADAVRFGPEAMGGVILVEPSSISPKSRISGELNLIGATNGRSTIVSGKLEGGIKKIPGFAWRFQATGKQAGNIQTADYYLQNTGIRELNFSGTLGYTTKRFGSEVYFSHFDTQLGIFTGSHIGNIDDLRARIESGRPFDDGRFSSRIDAPRQDVTHNLLKVKGHIHLKDNSHLDFLYGLQRNERKEFDIRRGGRSGIPSLDLNLTTQTIDVYLESINEKGWKKTAGINGLLQINNNVPGTLTTPLIPNYDNYNAGVYFIAKRLRNNYEVEGGVRYDHKYLDALGYDQDQNLYGGSRSFNNLSANAGAALHLSNAWCVRSNLGSAWRAPVVSELYSMGLHHGSAAFEKGDQHLSSEISYKWVTSTDYQSDRLSLELSVFLNYISDYIYLNPSGELYESIRGVFPTFDYKQTDARFLGSDLFLTYHFTSRLKYEVKGSLVRAKDIKNDRFLPWIPSDRLENSIGFESKKDRKRYIRITHLFVARQSRYQVENEYVPAPDAYHLFNLNAGVFFPVGQSLLTLNATLSNLTNTLYKEYMNRFRYYSHDQGRNLTIRAVLKF